MIAFGLDPDLHNTGWAIVDSDGPCLVSFGVIKVSSKFKQETAAVAMACEIAKLFAKQTTAYDLAAIEGQQVYLGQKKSALPQDLIQIAYVSGAAITSVKAKKKRIVRPSVWAKQMPKRVRQSRAFKALGVPYSLHETKSESWAVPEDPQGLSTTEWKHVADAVAIAYWAIKEQS